VIHGRPRRTHDTVLPCFTFFLERDDFSSNRHLALFCCLSMISAQTLCVCREGKPVPTFPDHALALFHPGAPQLFESDQLIGCRRLSIHRIAGIFRRCGPCQFFIRGWSRGSPRWPFQQRFREPGLAFVPAFSPINDAIGPPARVRI
jgi:hypothetical protein